MAKKQLTDSERYRQILESRGIGWKDCQIVPLVFPDSGKPKSFHFELMLHNIPHYLFDSCERGAKVIIPKDDMAIFDRVLDLASLFGGELPR